MNLPSVVKKIIMILQHLFFYKAMDVLKLVFSIDCYDNKL